MAKLSPREAAILRMAMHDESRSLAQGAMNTSPHIGAEYPKILYRKTEEAERRAVSQDKQGKDREWETLNLYNGFLCDVVVVDSADEAEAFAADGWDISPAAAHGAATGLVAATTAKDDEIAALRAELDALRGVGEMSAADAPKRGPGRPPRQIEGEI
jgi:hypothetical protein